MYYHQRDFEKENYQNISDKIKKEINNNRYTPKSSKFYSQDSKLIEKEPNRSTKISNDFRQTSLISNKLHHKNDEKYSINVYNEKNEKYQPVFYGDHVSHEDGYGYYNINSYYNKKGLDSQEEKNNKNIYISQNDNRENYQQNFNMENGNSDFERTNYKHNERFSENERNYHSRNYNEKFLDKTADSFQIKYKENHLPPIIKSQVVKEGRSRVIDEREMNQRYVPQHQENRIYTQEVETVKKEKLIEVIKEIPVPIEKFIDIPYDVFVDIPIERTIEREKLIEVIIEKPIEKIVEVPIEQIIEVPVERIIEVPVYINKYIERKVEKVVERPYDVIKENIIMRENLLDIDEQDLDKYDLDDCEVLSTKVYYEEREKIVERPFYVENIIEKEVKVPFQKRIEVPIEKIVKKSIPIYIDRPVPREVIIEREVEILVEVPFYKEVEVLVEKPVYITNIIEKRIPIDKIIEVYIDIPIEHIVEKPIYIDNIIEKKVDKIVEVPIEYQEVIEVPYEEITENFIDVEAINLLGKEKLLKKKVYIYNQKEINVDVEMKRYVKQEVNVDIPKKVNRFFEKNQDIIIEKEVIIERIREVPVIIEKIIEVPVEIIIENIIEKEIIIEKKVNIDVIIEKKVEILVEKIVEVPVNKIIEVPLTIYIEKPIYKEIIKSEDLLVNTNIEEYYENDEVIEYEREDKNSNLEKEINEKQIMLEEEKKENFYLQQELDEIKEQFNDLRNKANSDIERENIELFLELAELQSFYQKEAIVKKFLQNKEKYFIKDVEFYKDEKYDVLKNKLENLVEENHILCREITTKGENLKKCL